MPFGLRHGPTAIPPRGSGRSSTSDRRRRTAGHPPHLMLGLPNIKRTTVASNGPWQPRTTDSAQVGPTDGAAEMPPPGEPSETGAFLCPLWNRSTDPATHPEPGPRPRRRRVARARAHRVGRPVRLRPMLNASSEPNAQDWAIHDHEGFEPFLLDEDADLATVIELVGSIEGRHQ